MTNSLRIAILLVLICGVILFYAYVLKLDAYARKKPDSRLGRAFYPNGPPRVFPRGPKRRPGEVIKDLYYFLLLVIGVPCLIAIWILSARWFVIGLFHSIKELWRQA